MRRISLFAGLLLMVFAALAATHALRPPGGAPSAAGGSGAAPRQTGGESAKPGAKPGAKPAAKDAVKPAPKQPPKVAIVAPSYPKTPAGAAKTVRVMAIGSSVAKGWGDVPSEGGYLVRAFRTLSERTGVYYQMYNEAAPGASATRIGWLYPSWLKEIQPQVVVISWGMLDDAHDKTPAAPFEAAIRTQVQDALAAHAVVFVVSPPVTRASYTQYKTQEPYYLHLEETAAESFHSPNVYVLHVFSQMESYLAAHHQTYVPYMADGWHPNARGHALAGTLMTGDILQLFGGTVPAFKG